MAPGDISPSLSPQQQQWCIQRRDLLARMGLSVGVGMGFGRTPATAGPRDAAVSTTRRLDNTQRAVLVRLCDLVIPRTDTPGAVDVKVPVFLFEVLTRWLTAPEFTVFTEGLRALEDAAHQHHARAFLQCNAAQQTALLAQAQSRAYDYHRAHPEEVTSDSLIGKTPLDENTPFFTRLRELITIGYMTSEPVVRQQMVYLPVPGRYAGDASIVESEGKHYAW